MSISEIKIKNTNASYSIFIGKNILSILPSKIIKICPNAEKIALVVDKKIPNEYVNNIKKSLRKYNVFVFKYSASEKFKSFKEVNKLVEKCLVKNFNRNDIMISLGGGIIGDFSGFAASIIKRGINFINLPSTLLAQVDSSIGGKTGVNSSIGKNLIGAFFQPKLVISDVSLLNSLPHREIVCGYAEILKHSLILKNNFFNWLAINSKKIINEKNLDVIQEAVIKSCKIKLFYVNKDTHEKNIRMVLNFGHTFAHAIEVQNKYSKKINHGEAVIMGMMMAIRLSCLKSICSTQTLNRVLQVYEENNFNYKIDNFFKKNEYNKIVNHMINDKKNNDKKLNLILLREIGKTTPPNKYKMTTGELKKIFYRII